ncbi:MULTISPECIES: DEAD/DEAH box helicase [Myxococcus]|uniref:DEAD-box ATP-dependent RNA helicase RhpA n=1 Tax=Myxococcus xanthus TaxID=34 RepID=A0AAE6G1Q4_MYXXA|nr:MULTISPECIES: DEAD/DEAH box helicase [Myxococcus]QDE69090.1 DEAD/DEAH box helicase [Myxococcus xanthus]QDE76366.1 DEAD/DEAH box helicase [Myxococcus xanthus]QDE83791.1 DEAD/DEAH box helicase [Myxococcus xanthus]QDE97919.1 DEAD/DEAH box helicase [Myxococcus xanthus]WAM23070.1 DEAD/DEAH box helicase [Myxococcus sp. NMCA1]
MTFDELQLHDTLLRAVKAEGYTTPTPIQQKAIPHALTGRDVLGVAQTGTGKTAAFALPILQRLSAKAPAGGARPVRCLVLTPTRELAGQVGDSFGTYGKGLPLRHAVIFGGVGQNPQVQALRNGVDVLVATPGRLLDLMEQGFVSLRSLEVFVLDEADRMLDMGFIHDVRRVIKALPPKRQTLFFSATLPPDIVDLARSILTDPIRVEVTPASSTAETVSQQVYFVEREQKRGLLTHLLKEGNIHRALVFTRTKHGANRVAKQLEGAGVSSAAIHGNKSQNARERALDEFRSGTLRVLVATDIAARGIDIDGLSYVVNYDLPNVPEQYVHRIGRTGRAGASGTAVSFCDAEERAYLRDIERTIRRNVPVVEDHPYRSGQPAPRPVSHASGAAPEARPSSGNGGRSQGAPRPAGNGGGGGGHSAGASRRRRGGRGAGAGGGGRGQGRPEGGRSAQGSGGSGGNASRGGQGGSRGSGGGRPAVAQAPAKAPEASPLPPRRPSPKWF